MKRWGIVSLLLGCSGFALGQNVAYKVTTVADELEWMNNTYNPHSDVPLEEGGHGTTSYAEIPTGVDSDEHSGSNTTFPERNPAIDQGARAEIGPEPPLPSAPEPGWWSGVSERAHVPWTATEHQQPFSRVGIGANISPFGIGISSAIVLTQYFDARLMGNFFSFDSGNFEISGYRVDANLHLASLGTSLDWYPRNSVFRLSAGTLFYNGNQISAKGEIVPGTSFKMNGKTLYSASVNTATGATPLTGSGVVGLHRNQPGFTLSGGFGKFVPRSSRHWSFPFELGAAFIGAPTVDVHTAGWVCLDSRQTQCSNLADPANPVTIEFNNDLQAQLTKWRRELSRVEVYPMFAYSVVYSFDIR